MFRDSAVAYRGVVSFGTARIDNGETIGATTLLIALIVAAVIAFVVYGEYARKETVNGYLEPDRGVIRVFPPRAGVIDAMRVSNGDSVRRDEVLFNVVDLQSLPDGTDADAQLLSGYAERTARARRCARTRAGIDSTPIAPALIAQAAHDVAAGAPRSADSSPCRRSRTHSPTSNSTR